MAGMLIDYSDTECGWLTFFRNKEPKGKQYKITGTWYSLAVCAVHVHRMTVDV